MQRRKLIGYALPLLVNPAASAVSICRESKYRADVNIVANSFPVIQHLAKVAKSCTSDSLKVNVKLTSKVQNEVEIAFSSSGKSPFDAAVVSASVFNDLYSKNQLYSLKGLVSKFKDHHKIEEKMIVRMNGEPMAIAFMQNTQVLYYRRDIFKRLGLSVPKTYDEMFATAAIIKKLDPTIANPIAQCFSKGWDLATEFTNVISSLGGRFFQEGTALPAFNSEQGVQAIELMRQMLPYMSPNALASNADDVMNQLQQGRAAMGVLWASRASRMDDPTASKVVGLIDFAPAPAARVGGGYSCTFMVGWRCHATKWPQPTRCNFFGLDGNAFRKRCRIGQRFGHLGSKQFQTWQSFNRRSIGHGGGRKDLASRAFFQFGAPSIRQSSGRCCERIA